MIPVAFEVAVAIEFCGIIVTSGFDVQNLIQGSRLPDYLRQEIASWPLYTSPRPISLLPGGPPVHRPLTAR